MKGTQKACSTNSRVALSLEAVTARSWRIFYPQFLGTCFQNSVCNLCSEGPFIALLSRAVGSRVSYSWLMRSLVTIECFLWYTELWKGKSGVFNSFLLQ